LNALDTASPLIPWFCTFEQYINQKENEASNEERGYEDEFFAS
jgi:hypothetical protein